MLSLRAGARDPRPADALLATLGVVIAVVVYGMDPVQAGMSFVSGTLFGLLPVGWTIFNAMLLYNIEKK